MAGGMSSGLEQLKTTIHAEVDAAVAEFERRLAEDFLADCEANGRCPACDTEDCVLSVVTNGAILPGLLVGAIEYGELGAQVSAAIEAWCEVQECCCSADRVRAAIEAERGDEQREFSQEVVP